ncbi:MAG TPA: HupE/UreJ family protein [Chthoniobacterales bacterium]|nr:HupE/UreJ family protein [Chthoniobacterales bacterium]
MMPTSRSLILLVITLGCTAVGCGPGSLSVDEIVERNTQAMGGQAAIEAVKSIEVDLHITDPGFEVDGNYKAGIGMGTGGIVLPLFSFNLGVELGQIMVAALVLPIIWKLRENPLFIARWAPGCSAAVVLLGSFWFVQRVWMT